MKVANLVNDHGFIINKYYLYWYEVFWETQSKPMRAYAQSGQYQTLASQNTSLTTVTNIKYS